MLAGVCLVGRVARGRSRGSPPPWAGRWPCGPCRSPCGAGQRGGARSAGQTCRRQAVHTHAKVRGGVERGGEGRGGVEGRGRVATGRGEVG